MYENSCTHINSIAWGVFYKNFIKMKNNMKVIKQKKLPKNVNVTNRIREFKQVSNLIYITTKMYFKADSFCFYNSDWLCNHFMCSTQNTEINSYNSFSLVID